VLKNRQCRAEAWPTKRNRGRFGPGGVPGRDPKTCRTHQLRKAWLASIRMSYGDGVGEEEMVGDERQFEKTSDPLLPKGRCATELARYTPNAGKNSHNQAAAHVPPRFRSGPLWRVSIRAGPAVAAPTGFAVAKTSVKLEHT